MYASIKNTFSFSNLKYAPHPTPINETTRTFTHFKSNFNNLQYKLANIHYKNYFLKISTIS